MSNPRFEVPSGVIDGVNVTFTVSRPYRPGTTAVFLNGLLMERSLDDGWAETSPATGVVTLTEPPRPTGPSPEIVQIFFLDTAPPLPETQIFKLKGTIKTSQVLKGKLSCVCDG